MGANIFRAVDSLGLAGGFIASPEEGGGWVNHRERDACIPEGRTGTFP
jgi:hypothetical protein